METTVLVAILDSVAQIIRDKLAGNKTATNAANLESLVSAALTAYQQETGQPLDVTKIKPFTPIA